MSHISLPLPTGQTSVLNNRTGTANEIAFDTTSNEIIVYDGKTKGGIRMAKKSTVEELAEAVKALTTIVDDIYTHTQNNKILTKVVSED